MSIRLWALIALTLVLAACAQQAPLPIRTPTLTLPLPLHVQRFQDNQSQDWLLVIQQEGAALRWSLLDPLGMPLARQRLLDRQWQADGLLPPNAPARELFAALLFALTPAAQVNAAYPTAVVQPQQRTLDRRWQVIYRSTTDFQIQLDQGLSYHITPLPPEAAP